MKRDYRKRSLFDVKRLGQFAFTLLILFVAYTILTPPSSELALVDSPDGSKTARLRKFYYTSQPSYKIYYREAGRHIWFNLLYLPSYTNAPHQTATETIEWSSDSENLFFKINGTSIWSHAFSD